MECEIWLNNTFGPWKIKQEERQQDIQDFFDALRGDGLTGRPIADAIAAIKDLLNLGQNAAADAQRALMGIEAIRAEMAGGYYDEFDYQRADTLPAVDYTRFTKGGTNIQFGPDGGGYLTWQEPIGGVTSERGVWYRRDSKPLTKPTGFVSVRLRSGLSKTVRNVELVICGQWSAADQSRIQVRLSPTFPVLGSANGTSVQFQTVDGAGNATNVGAAKNISLTVEGDHFEFSWDATKMYLKRGNEVLLDVHETTFTPLAGRCIGFGAYTPNYTAALKANPIPPLKGVAWHS